MVKDFTGGKGSTWSTNSIGKDTFPASLDCLKPLGMWVSFGQSSGPVPAFEITLLSQKGSLFATRPSLSNYTATRKDLVATANDLFDVVARQGQGLGQPDLSSGRGRRAHQDLEARLTTGSTVLLPTNAAILAAGATRRLLVSWLAAGHLDW